MLALVIRTRRLRARSWAAPPASAASCHSGSSVRSSPAAASAWDRRRCPGSQRSLNCPFQTASPWKRHKTAVENRSTAHKSTTYSNVFCWPLQVSHQVTQGLVVGGGQLEQKLVDGLQSGIGIWNPCITPAVRIRAVMVWNNPLREALTRSLDEFRVQFERNDGNGEVSQVQFQSTGDDVDVRIGTGTDVGLVAIWCGEIRTKWCLCKCICMFLHV